MKKESAFVVLAVLCVGLGLVMVSSRGVRVALVVKQADAAYRDGAYQAKIDVDSGRKAHVSSGRWSTEARSGKAEPSAAEVAGYRDGVADGSRHRRASQPFQLNKTDNYRRTETGAGYRDAYSNGYQDGYYLPQESAELRTISQK